ncbi:MAG: hypothetical protein QM607_09810 [Microbacterium sp.]
MTVVTVVAALAVLGTAHGWPVVSVVFFFADPPKKDPPKKKGDWPEKLAPPPGTMRGGTTIGILERAMTIVALACGQPALIAAVVAIKAIGRFGELDGPVMRERFLIGSLASLGTAGLWGVAALLLIS